MISLRCSGLDLAAKCAPSALPAAIKIESSGKPANMGTAVHQFMSAGVGGRQANVEEIAAANGVDPDELGPACGQAWNAWKEIVEAFPNPEAELTLGPIFWGVDQVSLSGTADVVSLPTPSLARVCDWKSGFSDADHEIQVKGYALLIARERVGEVEAVEAVVINTRLGFKTVYRWSVQELESWWNRICETIVNEAVRSETYRPSTSACRWCKKASLCPARQQLVRSSTESLMGAQIVNMHPDQAADLLQRARLVAKAAEDAVELVRAEVAAAGGSLLLSDGRTLQLTQQNRRTINPVPAWPILAKHLGTRLPEALKVSKTTAEKIVGDQAPPRGKGKAKVAFVEELDAAGALETETVERLEVVRAAAQIESRVTTEAQQ